MARPSTFIGASDIPHCSGMVRGEGSFDVFLGGRPWSRFGDYNVPHLRPDGDDCVIHAAPISMGSYSVFINGKPAGRIGDKILGCTVVAEGNHSVLTGG
jgi:uncharacterized Zn-binding protein involved in type VI secretion